MCAFQNQAAAGMRPWTAILLIGLVSGKVLGKQPSLAPSQLAPYGAQQAVAGLGPGPLPATQLMTSDCSSYPFQVATSLYALGSSAGADLASALTSCLGQTACQVSVTKTASCRMGSILHASSLSAPQRNCTDTEQPVYVCKNFAVSPALYQSVQSGSCIDDFQQQSVVCSGTQLQRNLYQAILSGTSKLLLHRKDDRELLLYSSATADHGQEPKACLYLLETTVRGQLRGVADSANAWLSRNDTCCRELREAVRASTGRSAVADDPRCPGVHNVDAAAGRCKPRRRSEDEADAAGQGPGHPEQLLEL